MSQSTLGSESHSTRASYKTLLFSCQGEGVGVGEAEGQKGLLPKPSPHDDIPPSSHDPGL